MKLHSITLDGFWGYREGVRVEIAGLPLLVAVGHNGSGKSALVVSGVLAGLYGKFPTRTVEESITVGANTGTVIVEFDVAGCTYRVARAHQRSGGATASVHRMVDGEWEAVTEKGVREATAKVTEILGMNYDMAVMTWVAEQGQYGLFANAQPAARFKMLAAVFDLAKYGPMHRAAQDKLRAAKEAAAVAQGRVAELNDSLIDDDARADDQMDDAALAAAAAAAHTALDDASTALAAHMQNDPQIAVRHARTALAAVKDVRLERLRSAEQVLYDLRTARDSAPSTRDRAIEDAKARHERDRAAALRGFATTRGDLQRRIDQYEAELDEVSRIIALRPQLDADVNAAESAMQAGTERVTTCQARATECDSALRDADQALHRARTAVAEAQDALDALAHAGNCYACGQHITEQAAATLRASQEQTLAEREAVVQTAFSARETVAMAVDEAGVAAAHAAADANVAQQTLQRAQAALDEAERTIADADRFRDALAADRARRDELDRDEQVLSAQLTTELEEAIAAADATFTAQLDDITSRGKDAARAVSELRRPTPEEEELERNLTAAENIAQGDARYALETERLTVARDTARAQATSLDAQIGRREEIARRQAEFETRIAEAKSSLLAAQEEVTVHTDLVAAYAPGGIPSMILETVIGDLNSAVNVTLAELSGGELEVRLTTSRETSGGSAESKVTVYVDTPTGPRAYEALSGGQKFRVDLAIRTGLAAIIARGTGTPIETFILDEGWGSLDEAGIRSTLDVLGRLSERTNVLTVSHVDSVRDAFPARIEVSTNEGTSAATVIS